MLATHCSPPATFAAMQLFHRDLGGTGKPPLIILHGLLGSSRNWLTAGGDLAEVRHVIAPDLRNHGSSPHAPEQTYAAMEGDVLETLDGLGIRRFDLMGHSMGGKVAMHIACRHGDRVATLVAVDIAPRSYRLSEHAAQFDAMNALDPSGMATRREAEEVLMKVLGDPGMVKFLATNLERRETGGFAWRVNLPVLTAARGSLGVSPLGTEDRFDGPTLFLAGEKSDYVRESDRDSILAHFPRAAIREIPRAGHNPQIDARVAFVAAVKGFLGAAG